MLYPPKERPFTLATYTPQRGWVDITTVPRVSDGLDTDGSLTRACWRTYSNRMVDEEAERGEFFCCDLEPGAEVFQASREAGRSEAGVSIAPDGSGIIYAANYSEDFPVTTAPGLYWCPWGATEAICCTANVESEHGHIESFGFVAGSKDHWSSSKTRSFLRCS